MQSITVDGQPREFLLRQPPAVTGSATPMVISIHGATGTAAGQQATSTFDQGAVAMADSTALTSIGAREGFIAVFPQATEDSGRMWHSDPGSEDVAFVAALTEYLHDNGCSSPSLTTVNGFSMGAMMTSRLLCVHPDLYAGGAMVAGALLPLAGCELPLRTKVLVVHGKADEVVPYNGSLSPMLVAMAGPGSVSPVNRTLIAARWAKAKDCPSPGWASTGEATVTDYSCPPSTTLAVAGVRMTHTWDGPGVATSELIWAVMAPDQPCVPSEPAPPNPALARAITARLAVDIAFRVRFGRVLTRQSTCEAQLAATLRSAIQSAVAADPLGPVAAQLRFALRELARRPPATW
ncbi:MAG: polyhydroxybutyrate depolymerase [Actinomycetota bacterium]|nr:polyhydroxybutyrate depolymerase [Actinomycetota bacterium]